MEERTSLNIGKKVARVALAAVAVVFVLAFLFRDSSNPKITDASFPTGESGLLEDETNTTATSASSPAVEETTEQESGKEDVDDATNVQQGLTPSAKETSKAATDTPARSVNEEILGSDYDSAAVVDPEPTVAPTPPPRPSPNSASALGPFAQVPGITSPFRVTPDANGNTWFGDVDEIRISEKAGAEKVVLSKRIFDGEFDEDLPELSALTQYGDTTYVGTSTGMLLKYERYEWKALARSKDPIASRIGSIVATDKAVFIAARGLFKYDPKLQRVLAHPAFRDQTVSSFLTTKNGQLYLGSRTGLFRYNADSEDSWTQVWKVTPKDFDVYSLAEAEDGAIWIGTNNGIHRFSAKGQITEKHLSSQRVLSIATGRNGTLWAGTMKDGLRYFDGEQWYTVGSKQGFHERIEDVLLDSKGELWIAVFNQGLFRAPLAQAIDYVKKFPDTPIDANAPKQYSDFCHAVAAELPGIDRSKDISVESFEGEKLFFLMGVQECPRGIGYLRSDGAMVVLRGSQIVSLIEGQRRTHDLPKDYPVDKITSILLDSKSRLWLGTDGEGLLVYAGDAWNALSDQQGLRNNPITSVVEDETGNIWIGSTPPYDHENKTYHLKNLHLSNDKGWFQYDSRSGLIYVGTHSLALKKDGTLVVGTHAGLSLVQKDGFVTNIGQEQGLRPNFAYHVSVDAQDRIWIAHQYFGDGISWFDGKSLHSIGQANGLFNSRIIKIAHDRTRRVWLIASNGRVGIYPIQYLEKHKTNKPIDEKQIRSVNMFQRE